MRVMRLFICAFAVVFGIQLHAQFVEYPLADQSHPGGITAGPDGNVWFTERSADRIGRITPSGQIVEFALAAGADPNDITAGSDGNVRLEQMANLDEGFVESVVIEAFRDLWRIGRKQ